MAFKDRRLRQHEDALKIQQETEERVAATVLLTGYIAELLPTVLDGLKVSGYLLDEMKSDSEDGFMPWLVKEVRKEMDTMVDSRELLSGIKINFYFQFIIAHFIYLIYNISIYIYIYYYFD